MERVVSKPDMAIVSSPGSALPSLVGAESPAAVLATSPTKTYKQLIEECSAPAPVALIFDERMLLHVTAPLDHKPHEEVKYHVENANRILAIFHRLRTRNLLTPGVINIRPARMAEEADILRVHPASVIERVRACDTRQDAEVPPEGRLHLDVSLAEMFAKQPSRMNEWALSIDDRDVYDWDIHAYKDTYAGPYTPAVAQLAAGGVLQAVDAVVRDGCKNAFAIVRPPGHHCHTRQSGGFCFYNNIAVATRYAQDKYAESHGLRKVAIVDFDVHHGDGTQDIFYENDDVLFISVHRYDGRFYPGTGAAEEVGAGKGKGFSVNFPLSEGGMGEMEYATIFEYGIIPLLHEFKPDLILVSAGFDAAEGDPLGGMSLMPSSYGYLVQLLASVDPKYGIILALEGGYNLASIAPDAEECVQALIKASKPSTATSSPSFASILTMQPAPFVHASALKCLQQVAAAHAESWNSMAQLRSHLSHSHGAKVEIIAKAPVTDIQIALPVASSVYFAWQHVQSCSKQTLDMDAVVQERPAERLHSEVGHQDDVLALVQGLSDLALSKDSAYLPTLNALLADESPPAPQYSTRSGKNRSSGASAPPPKSLEDPKIHWKTVGSGELQLQKAGTGLFEVCFVDEAGRKYSCAVLPSGQKVGKGSVASGEPKCELFATTMHEHQYFRWFKREAHQRILAGSEPKTLCEDALRRGARFGPAEVLSAAGPRLNRYNEIDFPSLAYRCDFASETRAKDFERSLRIALSSFESSPLADATEPAKSQALTISFTASGEAVIEGTTVDKRLSEAAAGVEKPWQVSTPTVPSVLQQLVPADLHPLPEILGAKSHLVVFNLDRCAAGVPERPQAPCFPSRMVETFLWKMRQDSAQFTRRLPASIPLWSKRGDGTAFILSNAVDEQLYYILTAQNELEVRQIASITKVMTCIVVLGLTDANIAAGGFSALSSEEQGDKTPRGLDTEVIVSKRAASCTKGTVAGILEGDIFSAWDLLYGMMLPSGNDAATALAEHFGSLCAAVPEALWVPYEPAEHYDSEWERDDPISKFVAEMNRAAAVLGMKDTVFANPHGLAHVRAKSTAADVVRLLTCAWSDVRFRRIAGCLACIAEAGRDPTPPSSTGHIPATVEGEWISAVTTSDMLSPTTPAMPSELCTDAGAESAAIAQKPAAGVSLTLRKKAVKTVHNWREGTIIDREVAWENTNQLLRPGFVRALRVDGIKTGITPVAGGCLATHATSAEPSLLAPAEGDDSTFDSFFCVTLGSTSKQARFSDTRSLLQWCADAIKVVAEGGKTVQ